MVLGSSPVAMKKFWRFQGSIRKKTLSEISLWLWNAQKIKWIFRYLHYFCFSVDNVFHPSDQYFQFQELWGIFWNLHVCNLCFLFVAIKSALNISIFRKPWQPSALPVSLVPLSTAKFTVFNKWYICCILGTNYNFAHCKTIILDKKPNTGTFTKFELIRAGNYVTFLRKIGNLIELHFNSSLKTCGYSWAYIYVKYN